MFLLKTELPLKGICIIRKGICLPIHLPIHLLSSTKGDSRIAYAHKVVKHLVL